MKKYLFYIQSMIGGGAERVMSTLVNAFVGEGIEVYLSTNTSLPFAYEIDSRVHIIDMYKNDMPVTHSLLNKARRHIWKYKRIRSIAKEVAPDVAVSFVTALNNDVILSLIGTGIPVVVSEHTNINRNIPRKTKILRKLLYPLATAITVLTRHDYRIWHKQYKNVVYMPNPCDRTDLVVSPNERNKTVLAVGRVNMWRVKGFDMLLRSWGKICHERPEWRLQIAGAIDDSSLTTLEEIATNANCINYSFLGFRKDIKELMSASAVFVLSSRAEGLPMVLIEAMGSGCCCVATDCVTGPKEIIEHSVSGLLTKDKDVEDLAEKLNQVMSDEHLRYKLSRKAPETVARYSTERVINRWNILLSKIIH